MILNVRAMGMGKCFLILIVTALRTGSSLRALGCRSVDVQLQNPFFVERVELA